MSINELIGDAMRGRLPIIPGSAKRKEGRSVEKGVNYQRRLRKQLQAARREANRQRPQHRKLSVKAKRLRKLMRQTKGRAA